MATAISMSKAITKLLRVGGSHPSFHSRWIPRPPPPLSQSSSFFCSSPAISSAAASESTSSQSPEVERRSRLPKWLLFLPGAITFGLGTWQIFRRQDKVKMLEYREKRLEVEPLKFNKFFQSSKDLDSLEFRKILCKGVFDEERSIFVGPRSRSISGVTENGYYVITPLMPVPNDPESVSSPILVNRGWVPRIWRDKHLEVPQYGKHTSEKEPQHVKENETSSWWRFWTKKRTNVEVHVPDVTPVEVVGVIRGSERPSIFVPANEPSSSQWFYVDVPAIARACGLPEGTIYVEDINEDVNPSCPYPVPKDINTLIRSSVMPQDHLNYTLTWYSLSAAVTFMAFKRLRPKKSQR
ncbi:surfeit locus protein 1 [Ziziphus jujuba]|uniref:SURF1-like protein n=1 Tax=Ziziphus jujuba TaxID=326968 RepID=A0A6P6G6P4_ZIZJJ|nr:surfeit locus protein 1 [Ziziphus jujuba]XP_048330493.2 surfeit locus protein 1 [Ziziphus jujuba]